MKPSGPDNPWDNKFITPPEAKNLLRLHKPQKIHSMIIDDFMADPMAARKWALEQPLQDYVNPQDGVKYPGIIPLTDKDVWVDVQDSLKPYGLKPGEFTFYRLSTKGMHAPHQAHTDRVMSTFTLLVYMNLEPVDGAGTSILKHISGMDRHPETKTQEELWKKDCNDPTKWRVTQMCEMKFNRAFLIDSDLYHRAEPIGGFGKDIHDGRLVLTSFLKEAR